MALSHEFLEVFRIRTDVRRVETGLKRLGAGEDLQLAFLGLGRWMETDFAPPEQDETCRPLVDFGNECRPIRQRQIEIFDRQRQIAGVELFFCIDRQPVQVFDRRNPLLIRDQPRLVAPAANPFDVETPCGSASPLPELGEGID